MYTLLSIAKAHHASDLHITVGVRPKCRISGTLYEMDGFERLTPAMTKELVESMFNEKQKKMVFLGKKGVLSNSLWCLFPRRLQDNS
mgnify:CR=1 FL=1